MCLSKRLFLLLMMLTALNGCRLFAQTYGGDRTLKLILTSDSLRYDSLSSVPGSVKVFSGEYQLIEGQEIEILAFKSTIIFDSTLLVRLLGKEIVVRYRAFAINLEPEYRLRGPDSGSVLISSQNGYIEGIRTPGSAISRQGSLSRGISTGNQQNSALSSDFNLQLAGRLSDRYEIRAALSDRNIPLQPEGTTTQLQEFDRIFIELTGPQERISAGDMLFTSLPSHFLRYGRKTQGLAAEYRFNTSSSIFPQGKIQGGLSLSKGKYQRQNIQVREADQGPYRLPGANGESFIIVISGSEKVFLDGELMERGSDRDYVIDYNSAQLTFMQRRVISAQSRVTVEYEYMERSYARGMSHAGVELKGEDAALRIQLFSENDMKSQNFQQALGEDEIDLLSQIGDSLGKAIIPRIDSVAFNSDEVLYRKTDTLVNGTWYYNILIYSTNADSAHYRVGFTYVGSGKGDYIRIASAANGKVYQWVAPSGGSPGGDYQPVSLIVAPQSRQGLSAGLEMKVGRALLLQSEFSLSRHDLNTFSAKDKSDDLGAAAMLRLSSKKTFRSDSSRVLTPFLSLEWEGASFSPVERYLPAEFERDWNLRQGVRGERLQAGAGATFQSSNSQSRYIAEIMHYGSEYLGIRQLLAIKARGSRYRFDYQGSLLNSYDSLTQGNFYRHRAQASLRVGSAWLNASSSSELNRLTAFDSLDLRSIAFHETGISLSLPDSASFSGSTGIKYRRNYLPDSASLNASSESIDAELALYSHKFRNQKFDVKLIWRMLDYEDSTLGKPEQYLLSRVTGSGSVAKGSLRWRLAYESSSGSELKKELSYLRVGDGQGLYAWSDYNGDSVKQLDEFELAIYRDQANYIRIFLPGTAYESVVNARFLFDLEMRAPQTWHAMRGWRGQLAKFSGDASLKLDTRTVTEEGIMAYLPDPGVKSNQGIIAYQSSWQSRLYFRRGDPKFGIDLSAGENSHRSLMANGVEDIGSSRYQLRMRIQVSQEFLLNLDAQFKRKTIGSEFYTARNYRVSGPELEPSLSWQPGRIWRIRMLARWQQKADAVSDSRSESLEFMLEGRYSMPGLGFVQGSFSRRNIAFEGEAGSPVAWEMLNSLQEGVNYIWGFSIHYAIRSDIQIALQYDGRKPAGLKAIHTGLVQGRYLF
jgi:hypothetical protein